MKAAVPAAYLVTDRDGRIIEHNADVSLYLEYGDELVGQSLSTLLPLASRVFFQTHVFPTLARDGRVDEVYLPLKTKGGESLPVVLNCRAEIGGARVELLFMPMRRRTFFERELVRARRAAELSALGEAQANRKIDVMESQVALAERLASIGELAAAVAHEINNPLAYVIANVELLESAGNGTGDRSALLADIQLGLSRIRDIVGSLKKLSRVDTAQRSPVRISQAIEDALKIAGNDLRHRARVELVLEERGLHVMGDESRLGQVFLNLLINAAHALPEDRLHGNMIRIETRRCADGFAEIVVADNGPGIPRELHERVFEPFFTTKAIGTGTGLGLSVCHGVVTSLGGTIAVESVPEQGARFTIRLPLVTEAEAVSARPASAPVSGPAPAASSHKILVVDDDEGIRRVLVRLFRDQDVVCCDTATDVWRRFLADGLDDYDVIVCDLMMPELTGMELYTRVTGAAPHLARRFLFLTGGAFTESSRTFLETPGRRTIAKPFRSADVRAAVLELAQAER